MTGHKRKAEASLTGNHPAAPPARRSRRGAAPAPPSHDLEAPASRPRCEVPAAGMVRPPSPVHTMETMHMDLTHRLRSGRKVFVPITEKPGPMQFKKGERAVPDLSWQTPACAKVGLEHYNLMNEEDEHELVKPIDSIVFFFNGPWMHANFLAKSKRGTTHADLLPKYFFAELKIVPGGKRKLSCVSCIKMDPVNRKTAPVRGCRTCPSRILHPAAGGYQGGPIQHPSASEDRAVSTAAWTARPPSPVLTMETMHLNLTHILRSGRKVFVPATSEPSPRQYKKGEEPVYDVSWQTPACAKVALEHYNRLNKEDEHELVKAVDSVAFFFNGLWMHANFLAKSKGAESCVDHFFAEVRVGPDGKESCVSCTKMDPVNPETKPVRGCTICPSRMLHPAAGGHRGVPVLHIAARRDQVKT